MYGAELAEQRNDQFVPGGQERIAMDIYLYTIHWEERMWAVMHIMKHALVRQYALTIRSGLDEKTILIDEEDYNGLFDPEVNPPQCFALSQ